MSAAHSSISTLVSTPLSAFAGAELRRLGFRRCIQGKKSAHAQAMRFN